MSTSRVLVVGSGRVATALAGGLRLAGVPVCGLWGRREVATKEAAEVAGVPAVGEAGLAEVAAGADVVFFAVSDRAIPEVAASLAARGVVADRHVALHGSGAMAAAEALAPLAGLVRGRGTLHLLRAVPDGAAAMRELAGTYIGVEGDPRGLEEANELARALGGTVFELRSDAMPAYHAAAALASNGAVALLDAAAAIAAEAGIPAELAPAALAELARGSVAAAGARGTTAGLTGPIRRGDAETVARHLGALAASPDLQAFYRAIGRRALAIARRHRDVDPARLDAIEELLDTAS